MSESGSEVACVATSVELLIGVVRDDVRLLAPIIDVTVDDAAPASLVQTVAGRMMAETIAFARGQSVWSDPWPRLKVVADLFYGTRGLTANPGRGALLWPSGFPQSDGVAEHLFRAGSRLSYYEGRDLTEEQVQSLLDVSGELAAKPGVPPPEGNRFASDDGGWIVPAGALREWLPPPQHVRARPDSLACLRLGPSGRPPVDLNTLDLVAVSREAAAIGVGRVLQRAMALWPCVRAIVDTPVCLARVQETELARHVDRATRFARGDTAVSVEDYVASDGAIRSVLYGRLDLRSDRSACAGFADSPDPAEPYHAIHLAAVPRLSAE